MSLAIITFITAVIVVYDVSHVSKKEFRELSENHPIRERLQLSKKERKRLGLPPNRYYDDQYLLEMDPRTGKTHPENVLEVKEQLQKSSTFVPKVPGQDTDMAWVERGPNNIAGRTRVAFYDPNDTTGRRVFAGGVSGGLWVNNNIADENSSWTQIGIDENLAISCFAIDPNNSNTWYVGTGEAFTGDDGVGNGIWMTRDGGTTWTQILSIDLTQSHQFRPYVITQILAWNNGGTTEVYYSVDGKFDIDGVGGLAIGWWKFDVSNFSTDRIDFFTEQGTPFVFNDIEIAQDNSIWVGTKSNIFGHGGGQVFRSIDGINFEEKHSFSNGDRVELTLSKQDPNVVYVLASTNRSSSVELLKTVNGSDFNTLSRPNDVDTTIPANDFAREQGFYNLTLEIDPTNDEVVYAGGIDLFKSTNSGTSWAQISKWSNFNGLQDLDVSLVHADHHAVVFNPLNSNQCVFTNDGGVYYCPDLTNVVRDKNIVDRNRNYNITQFYSAAIHQDEDNEFFLGGSQDNGSLLGGIQSSNEGTFLRSDSGVNAFIDIFGGDGIQNFIDKDGEYLIVSFVNNVYTLVPFPLDDPRSRIEIVSDQTTGTFVNIAELDDNLDILYTDGSRYSGRGTVIGVPRIFRFSNITSTPQRTILTNVLFDENPTAIKVSPFTTNGSTLFIGTQGSSILKVTNANTNTPTWQNITLGNPIDIGSVSSIDLGRNENEILVSLHNYGVNNIYYTNNGGVTWQRKEGNFPDIPVKAIKMSPLNNNDVIIGTNMGVWATNNFLDENPFWFQSFNGMSNVRVTQFDLRTSDNTVLAATYGRGLFTGKFNLAEEEEEKLESNIKFSSTIVTNGQLNIEVDVDKITEFRITINDFRGALVFDKEVKSSQLNDVLDISNLTSGIYIVNIMSGGDRLSEKIIIN